MLRNTLVATALLMGTFIVGASETCEDMKTRITGQAKANGVADPQVEILDKGDAQAKHVVAHCGHGKKVVTLEKGKAPARQ